VKEYGNVIKVADLTYSHAESNIKPVGFVIELCRRRTAPVITTDAVWLRFNLRGGADLPADVVCRIDLPTLTFCYKVERQRRR
jgi:hypothetical protein